MVRILCLEDEPLDYELVVKEIEKIGFPFESIRVWTKDDFLDTIQSFKPNLILSDYSLPSYNGLEAVRDLKKLNVSIPFIIVSGRVNQEIATECLQSGADDYVLKDHLSSIVQAIRNVLKIYEEQSAREKVEKELKTSKVRLSEIIEYSPIGKAFFDNQGKLISSNRAFKQIFGIPNEKEPVSFCIFDRRFILKEKQDILAEKHVVDFEMAANSDLFEKMFLTPLLRKGHFNLEIMLNSIPVGSFLGEKEYLLQVVDSTEKKKTERMQMNFISNISHEMRTPLTSMKESVAILMNHYHENLSEDQQFLLSTAHRNLIRLEKLIADILDFQKINKENLPLNCKQGSINKLIKQTHRDLLPLFQKSKLEIRFDLDNSIPLVMLDQDRLMQVLCNLFSNAIKFTQKGSITVSSAMDGNEIRVSVSDTGIGIPTEELTRIFEPFYQSSENQINKEVGNGLGLTISKKIIEAHQGRILVSSELGKGSTFSIYLPI